METALVFERMVSVHVGYSE